MVSGGRGHKYNVYRKDNSGDLWVELQDGTTVEAMYRKPDWLKN